MKPRWLRGGQTEPPRRLVTQPQRGFSVDQLAALARPERRRLCQLLLTETGAQVSEVSSPAGYDEFVLEATPLWRSRTIRVRIAVNEATQDDVDRLSERVGTAADADGLLITPAGQAAGITGGERVGIVAAEELIARLERSPSIAWLDDAPQPAYERVEALRGLERDAALLDPVGFRWLPILALNELPAGLEGTPQDWLERFAFRLLTSTFRFGGERYGEARRGQRFPDSAVTWREGGSVLGAVVDCKAAASGYTMTADHERRFHEYVGTLRPVLEAEDISLNYLIVISSSFPGDDLGDRDPFRSRAEAFERSGVKLVYLRAIDLSRVGVAVEARELPPAERESIEWSVILGEGRVTSHSLERGTGITA
jgi:hypothetical protein